MFLGRKLLMYSFVQKFSRLNEIITRIIKSFFVPFLFCVVLFIHAVHIKWDGFFSLESSEINKTKKKSPKIDHCG